MNPVSAVQSCLRQYVVFSGRAPRSEYWWWFSFVGVVNIFFVLFFPEDVAAMAGFVALVVTFLPSLAVTVRRLHDGGWTGWWAAPVAMLNAFWIYALWIGAYDFGVAMEGSNLFLLFFFVSAAGWLLVFIRMFTSGSRGTNRFGPDPIRAGSKDDR